VHRRTAAIAALVVVATLASPAAVFAAGATLRGPADGVVDGPTDLEVRITREPFEAITSLEAGLRRGGAALAGSRSTPLCEGWRDCPNGDRTADYRIAFDPRTGAPFLPEDAVRFLPNGPYELRIAMTINNAAEERSLDLILSLPPSAATDVGAEAEGGLVTLRWQGAPEPDVAGYRIERTGEGGGWSNIADVSASASSFADEPGAGSHRYRLVTVRPDGKGGSYEVTSSEAEVAVSAPRAAPGAGSDPEAAGSDGARSDTDRDAAIEADGGEEAEDGDAAASATTSPTAGQRSGASGLEAPTPQRGTARTPTAPGEDHDPDVVEETLTYDGEPIAADRPDRAQDDRGEVLLTVPGVGPLSGALDDQQAAVPVAGGLLLTAIGLHLWRWLQLPIT
jgi:hypothetical protein